MKYLILTAFISFFQLNSTAQRPPAIVFHGDIAFSRQDYKKAICYYKKVDFLYLSSDRISKFIISEYKTDNIKFTDSLITIWVNDGAMPSYIKGILSYRFSKISPSYVDSLFSPEKIAKLNKIYGQVIATSPVEFYNTSRIYSNDQHLRFLEIEINKMVDKRTFISSDSVNLQATKKFLIEYGFPTKKEWCKNLMFGVIHHYCAEVFFTKDDFVFFQQKMKEMVDLSVLSIESYCYFVDKFSVFNGEKQVYGTYYELEGLVGVNPSNYKEINRERNKIGYMLTIEDQLKYNL